MTPSTTIRLLRKFPAVSFFFFLLLLASSPAPARPRTPPVPPRLQAQNLPPASSPAEQGKFRLHKFEQPIGEETYSITSANGSQSVDMKFQFTDRGQHVPLHATLRAAADGTPQFFEISGSTSRISTVNEAVDVQPSKIRIRNGKVWSEAPRPPSFFTIEGYAPATDQMLLIRYWKSHGMPATLPTFPHGSVQISLRGQDEVPFQAGTAKLSRFSIGGLIWGNETLWMDSSDHLAAVVTVDAEFDHFEAVRDDFESSLPSFVSWAAQDGMARLASISSGISGVRSDLLAITGATLVDAAGHPPLPNATVLVSHGRISAIGPSSKIKIPKAAKRFDAHGMTLLPGLWDMHAHFEQVEWGPLYLAAGATTVRDVGNETEFITSVRDAIASGSGLGPRMFLAGLVDGQGPLALGVNRVTTPAEARAAVDHFHSLGFQQMKIYSSVKLEEVQAVAAEAHRLGMTVTGHIPEGMNAYQGVDAGMDQINHIQYIMDILHPPFPAGMSRIDRFKALANLDLSSPDATRALQFLKAHNTVIDPTLSIFELFTASPSHPVQAFEPGVLKVAPELRVPLTNTGVPDSFQPVAAAVFAKEVAAVGALHREGIRIIAGTDQAVPGHSLHRELELYVQAGFTPLEAIQAATIVPASVLGVDADSGTVEVGKRADMILTEGNPLDSIHNIRNVRFVITSGVLYNCADLWRSVDFEP